ncbi:hypothetical protein BDZ97DRAFT_1925367 [Flammula alnicola]|nr:hypothetical protein BDZ97DRAFT_1925367 [Flammula alnicola]
MGNTLASAQRTNQANFDGVMLAALAYGENGPHVPRWLEITHFQIVHPTGALIMLYIQITQVLLRRPKRGGRKFWIIIIYSTVLFPLTTFAFAGKFKFTEELYLALPNFPDGPEAYMKEHAEDWPNLMSQVCTTIVPWFGDLLMLYRVMVVWNYQWWLLVLPGSIYLTRVGLSIPLLIVQTRPESDLSRHYDLYGTVFYSLCLSLNITTTTLICVRLYTMRHKAERVLGTLQASLYNSSITMFVESGAFFTVWSLTYVISRATGSWVGDIFLEPYSYIIALTRMLIVLRMAQDRAWSREIITAADDGVLDWQVTSTNSVALNNASEQPDGQENLPKKFRDLEDSFSSSKSTLSRKA